MSRSLCRPGLEPTRAAMVLPAALGIVLTAGLGLGSIAVSPTAGADELGSKAAQAPGAAPAAVDGAKASTPRVNRPIDQIVGRSGDTVEALADAPAGVAEPLRAAADSDAVDPAPAPMGGPRVNNLRRATAAPSPAPRLEGFPRRTPAPEATTPAPGESPTPAPPAPSATSSAAPSLSGTASPSPSASAEPTASPSAAPSASLSASPSASPSATANGAPEASPSGVPSASPSASAAASPRAITGKPRLSLGDGGSFGTTALAFKGSNWADAKGNALNGTVNMTVALRGGGGAIDRKATIPVKMENGAFSTMIDAESLFHLTTKDLVDNGWFRLRVSSPDGGVAESRLFSFVPGGAPAPRPTNAPTARPSTPAPTSGPTAPAPTADPKPAPTAEPTTAPTTQPAPPAPTTDPTAPAPTTDPTAPAPTADPKPAPPAPTADPTAPAPTADPKPAPTAEPTTAPTMQPVPPAPEAPAPEAPAPEPVPEAPAVPGARPEGPAAEPAAPVAPPTITATLPAAPGQEPAPAQPEASPSASPSAQPTEPKPSDPPRGPVADGSQLTADNAGSLSGGRQGDRVSLVLPKDKAKEGDWVAVFLYPGGKSAGWVQVDHSNSVKVDISNIDAGSHKLAIAGRDSQLLGWVQLEIARTDTVNTDLMDKANGAPVKEAVLGGDDWMLISAAGILTAGAAAYMFLARPRARRPVQ
ncbi:hypothetical protein [Actinomyces marmotae]|uniref:hypothetical protein n=1 Tax=Actinomyces marmotae TaxID=2737173 RepID=UPI001F049E64|nr:hypothetical protein [Actinomyces marmotae]